MVERPSVTDVHSPIDPPAKSVEKPKVIKPEPIVEKPAKSASKTKSKTRLQLKFKPRSPRPSEKLVEEKPAISARESKPSTQLPAKKNLQKAQSKGEMETAKQARV